MATPTTLDAIPLEGLAIATLTPIARERLTLVERLKSLSIIAATLGNQSISSPANAKTVSYSSRLTRKSPI